MDKKQIQAEIEACREKLAELQAKLDEPEKPEFRHGDVVIDEGYVYLVIDHPKCTPEYGEKPFLLRGNHCWGSGPLSSSLWSKPLWNLFDSLLPPDIKAACQKVAKGELVSRSEMLKMLKQYGVTK